MRPAPQPAYRSHFYPRPPRGGRPDSRRAGFTRTRISIHALREEGDIPHLTDLTIRNQFLSTPSARRATSGRIGRKLQNIDFYPRPPRGGRLQRFYIPVRLILFLSTPSARRATAQQRVNASSIVISIHALREEGDAVPDYPVHHHAISIHALREEGDAIINALLYK